MTWETAMDEYGYALGSSPGFGTGPMDSTNGFGNGWGGGSVYEFFGYGCGEAAGEASEYGSGFGIGRGSGKSNDDYFDGYGKGTRVGGGFAL